MQGAVAKHDHVVQFYETDSFLASVVAPFLSASLRRGGSALLLCTIEHFSAIANVLKGAGLDLGSTRRGKRVVWRDARMLLQNVQVNGEISRAAFQREIAAVVCELCARSNAKPLHVFGELVDLLWADGRTADALLLENMWHELSESNAFNLMCSYRVAASRRGRGRLRAVCAAHSHVLQPEKPMGIAVLEDGRGRSRRFGEHEMVRTQRVRDQRIADGLREDLAQSLVGLLMLGDTLRAGVPQSVKVQVDELIQPLHGMLRRCLAFSHELAPVQVRYSSLISALQKYAAMMERLFDIACVVIVGRAFDNPDRPQRELLCAIVREVVDRAVRERGARQITIKLTRRAASQQLAIYHDGDSMTVIGTPDDRLRRLIYEARALGNKLNIRPSADSSLQLRCGWGVGRPARLL